MVEQFDDWEEERIHRTREERVPQRDKNAPQMHAVRVFTTLAEVLGYDQAEGDAAGIPDEGALSADEAALLKRIESGDYDPSELLRLG